MSAYEKSAYEKRARDRVASSLFVHIIVVTVGSGPVGLRAIISVSGLVELRIREVGPIVLVETGRFLEAGFVDVHDEALLVGVDRQRRPRYREQLVAHSEEATERQNGIRNASL